MKWVTLFGLSALLLMAGTAGAAALIDGGDVKNGSLTGKDVKNKSLTKRDFRGSVRGPRGFTGPQGPQGIQGPPGPVALSGITTSTAAVGIAPSDFDVIAAPCPAGQRVVSGGVTTIAGSGGNWTDRASDDRTAWIGGGEDLSGTGGTLTVYAYCATIGQAVAASRRTFRDEVRPQGSARRDGLRSTLKTRIAAVVAVSLVVVVALSVRPPAADAHSLGWYQAKRAALRVANSFPISWERRKVDWCNRWSRHEVHCGVSAWNTEYDYDLGTSFRGDECSATAIVTLPRYSSTPRVRGSGDRSCFYSNSY